MKDEILLLLSLGVCLTEAHAQQVGYTGAQPGTPAAINQNITNTITAPNSTGAFKMQGLAGTIVPGAGGIVDVSISGTVISNTGTLATAGIKLQLSYGTGTAPTTNATLTGTQVGAIIEKRNGFALTADTDAADAFKVSAVISGLTQGTTYWLDLAAESVTTASDKGLSNVNIAALEQRAAP